MDAQDFGRYPDHVGHSSKVMGKASTHAKGRPRMHSMKRRKAKDWGNRLRALPWPADARALSALYRVPTTTGWRSAHVSV